MTTNTNLQQMSPGAAGTYRVFLQGRGAEFEVTPLNRAQIAYVNRLKLPSSQIGGLFFSTMRFAVSPRR